MPGLVGNRSIRRRFRALPEPNANKPGKTRCGRNVIQPAGGISQTGHHTAESVAASKIGKKPLPSLFLCGSQLQVVAHQNAQASSRFGLRVDSPFGAQARECSLGSPGCGRCQELACRERKLRIDTLVQDRHECHQEP